MAVDEAAEGLARLRVSPDQSEGPLQGNQSWADQGDLQQPCRSSLCQSLPAERRATTVVWMSTEMLLELAELEDRQKCFNDGRRRLTWAPTEGARLCVGFRRGHKLSCTCGVCGYTVHTS